MSKKPTNSQTGKNIIQSVSTHGQKAEISDFSLQIIKSIISNIIIVFFYVGIIVLFSNLGKQAYNFAYPIFGDISVDSAPGRNVKVTISNKDDLSDIAADLGKKGIIENKDSFYIRGKLSINKNRTIEPGTYVLNTSENYGEILNILTNVEEEVE